MENNKQNIKMILYPILYWVIFIVIPFIITQIVKIDSWIYNFAGLIFIYILFIAPLLFIVPYKLLNFTTKAQRIIFWVIGLVLPYIIIYIYAYYQLIHMYDNFKAIG
ncbi:MAG: hypothetical protein HYV53_00685 [Parcubacteria group bacterium]|nr:hypothetical protein [Parcubacteria group bacterium]